MILLKKAQDIISSIPFLLSGLALVLLVIFDLPMYFFLGLQFFTIFLLFYIYYRRRSRSSLKSFSDLMKTGFWAGLLGTAGYDIIRLLLVAVFHLHVRPFDTFKFFGQIILNRPVSNTAAYLVGFAYHMVNGITFAIAFMILFTGRHWGYGILWAFLLEIAMLVIYPRFLNVQSFMDEFAFVSSSGHAVYGAVIGLFNYHHFKKSKLNRHVIITTKINTG